MRPSSILALCVAALVGATAIQAQTSGTTGTTTESLADRQPSENVRGGAVRERAPGRIVGQALARHRDLAERRLAAQRNGNTSDLLPEDTTSGSAASSGLTGSLSDLIGSLLGSGLGSSLLSGTTGGSSGNFSNLPPEVIQMLNSAGISLSDLRQKSQQDSATESSAQPKTFDRAQTSTQTQTQTEERSFVVRWADAMLSTFFTAITVGFQTQDFIDTLKDALRPLFFPAETDSGSGGSDSSGDGGGGGTGGTI